jgi:AraC-like DNA-binding protein
MLYYEIKPCFILENYIKCFFCNKYPSDLKLPNKQYIPPDGCVDIEFHTGISYEVSFNGQNFSALPSSAVIMGLAKKAMTNKNIHGGTTIIGAKFFPYGAHAFLKTPIHEFVNQVVAVKEFWKDRGRDLEENLLNSVNPNKAIEILQKFLVDLLTNASMKIDSVSKKAVNMMIESRGTIKVTDIFERFNISERQLERKFKNYIGLEPKLFLKIIRFNCVLDYIFAAETISLVETAQMFGYYDQSHFTRDLKLFTGMTPNQYFKAYHLTKKIL